MESLRADQTRLSSQVSLINLQMQYLAKLLQNGSKGVTMLQNQGQKNK
jgi:hypothetical protein